MRITASYKYIYIYIYIYIYTLYYNITYYDNMLLAPQADSSGGPQAPSRSSSMYVYIYIYILFFSHEPSLARHLKSVVQILTLILAHRPMAQWLPCII